MRISQTGEVKSGAGPVGSQLKVEPSGLEACSVRPAILFAGPAAIRITSMEDVVAYPWPCTQIGEKHLAHTGLRQA